MTTDITALAKSLKAAANTTADAIDRLKAFPGDEIIDLSQHEDEQIDIDITTINEWYELSSPANILALVEVLEKAQRYTEELREWNAGLAQESCEPVAWMHNNNDIGIPAITVSQKVGHYWMAEFENVQPLYRHAQSAPELTAIVDRLNGSGYEYEGWEVTPQNAAAVVNILLQQLDDAVQSANSKPVKRVNADQMQRVCLEANRHLDKYGAMAREVNKLLGHIPAQQPAPVVMDDRN